MSISNETHPNAPQPVQFRAEALAHQQQRLYGTILVGRPLSHVVLTGVFTCAVVALFAFLCTFDYTRKARVSGFVVPAGGAVAIAAPQAGFVGEKLVSDGSTVEKGDVLAVIRNERLSGGRTAVEEKLGDLLHSRKTALDDELRRKIEMQKQRKLVFQERLSKLEVERSRIGEQVTLQEARVRLSSSSVNETKRLVDEQFLSAAQMREKEGLHLDQLQRLGELRRELAAKEADIATAVFSLKELEGDVLRETNEATKASLLLSQEEVELSARREIQVISPVAGTIGTFSAKVGQHLQFGDPVAVVLPKGQELEIELYVPSESVRLVKLGMPITISFRSHSYQLFGQGRGTVREISGSAVDPRELANTPLNRLGADRADFYRVRASIEKSSDGGPLRAGTLTDVTLQLERRRLIEWMIAPLRSIAER